MKNPCTKNSAFTFGIGNSVVRSTVRVSHYRVVVRYRGFGGTTNQALQITLKITPKRHRFGVQKTQHKKHSIVRRFKTLKREQKK